MPYGKSDLRLRRAEVMATVIRFKKRRSGRKQNVKTFVQELTDDWKKTDERVILRSNVICAPIFLQTHGTHLVI
jgi:hypothetical protein